MTEEEILDIVREYKKNVLDGFTAKRRKVGLAAYLPPGTASDGMTTEEIKGAVIAANQGSRSDLYGRIQTNQFDIVEPLAKRILAKQGVKNAKGADYVSIGFEN